MVRRTRKSKRMVGGKSGYKMLVGSRSQVMNGTAYKTSYGTVKPVGDALTKKDLKYNKSGKIVSKKKSSSAKKDNRLVKAGYKTEKGKFGSVFVDPKEKKKSPRKSSAKKIPKKRKGSKNK